jgi:hypothetical protein
MCRQQPWGGANCRSSLLINSRRKYEKVIR